MTSIPLTIHYMIPSAPVSFIPARFVDQPRLSKVTVHTDRSNLTLECVSHGAPIPTVTWQRLDQAPLAENRIKQLFG